MNIIQMHGPRWPSFLTELWQIQ